MSDRQRLPVFSDLPKQRNDAAQRVILKILKAGDAEMLSDINIMMDFTDAIIKALLDRAKRLEQAENRC